MTTGSVIGGSGVAGLMVWTPAPGMLKSIVSSPGLALAFRIAWRSEPTREPSWLSVRLVTAKGDAGATAVAANCEVLPSGPVTVAVRRCPLASGVVRFKVAVKPWLPELARVSGTLPRNWTAGPTLPLVSLAKNSTV